MVLLLTGDKKIIGGIGVGVDIHILSPENCRTIHCKQTHHGYVSGVIVAPWDAVVPAVVGTEEPVPGGDSLVGKVGINDRYGGEGGLGQSG